MTSSADPTAMTPNRASDSDAPRIAARIGCVIINYRTPALIESCLRSLAPQLAANDMRVMVVDNNSGDGSADQIAAFLDRNEDEDNWKDRVTLVRSQQNTGFSGGNNIGVDRLDAEFYLLMNSDTLARPGAIAALLAAAERHPDAGLIGPRLEDEDGAPQISAFRSIGLLSEFVQPAELRALERLFPQADANIPIVDAVTEADWVSFACVLIRRAVIDAIGPMDEGYFMYFEDADYCRTAKAHGWRAICDPSARVVHFRGGSSSVKSAHAARKRPPAYFYASRTRYFRKFYGPLGPTIANIAWLAARGIARAKAVFGRTPSKACERAASDIWINWRDPLGDRRAPQ